MSNVQLLSPTEHRELTVSTERSAELGDNQWFTVTFPWEFRQLQAYYPIFFHKDRETGQLFPAVLMGFEEGENLYLREEGWAASYVPLVLQREPFYIGRQYANNEGVEKSHRVISVDLEHPRVKHGSGERVFEEHGGHTPFLTSVADMLETIHHGMNDSAVFVSMLTKLKLIEQVTLNFTLDDGSRYDLGGFYTISEDNLKALSGDELAELNSKGYLEAIYYILASHGNVKALLTEKNKRMLG